MPLFRRAGRPGLLGTEARSALVAGAATETIGVIEQHQTARYLPDYQQQQLAEARAQEEAEAEAVQAARPPTPSSTTSHEWLLSELERLGHLHATGVLTDTEFASVKAVLLDEPHSPGRDATS